MSSVVHVFEHEPPATLDEALAVFERLSGVRTTANAKFARLAQALIRRFPSEVGGQAPLQPLWLESVPDGQTDGSAVYSLGLYGAASSACCRRWSVKPSSWGFACWMNRQDAAMSPTPGP